MKWGTGVARATLLLVCLAVLHACARSEPPTETTLKLPPNETSALLSVKNPALLAAQGWETAFWTVSDEARAEACLALIGHSKSPPTPDGWEALKVTAQAPGAAKSDDAEALCRHGDSIYLVGSHFGKKAGPLQPKRHFLARFLESAAVAAGTDVEVELEVVVDAFRLHQAINEALRRSAIPLIACTEAETKAFITETLDEARKDKEPWLDRLTPADRPINIEGAAFLPSGALLLGLRYPVTAAGHPILVAIDNVEALFDPAKGEPSVARIWTVDNEGNAAAPAGIRAISRIDNTLHVLTGNLDSDPDRSAILEAHPEGQKAVSAHYMFPAPSPEAAAIRADLVRQFPGYQDVEGIAFAADAHVFYVRDRKDEIAVLHE